MNLIWILIGGVWISLSHIIIGILLGITIVGIPFAKQHFKLASLVLTPFGKTIIQRLVFGTGTARFTTINSQNCNS